MGFSKENKLLIKFIVALFLLWRTGLCLIAFIAGKLLSLREGYLGESIWANFDGVHYLNIAKHGYYQFQQAFFPFYPYFIRYLAKFFKNYLFSGLFISHFAFFVSLYLFYQLVRLDFAEEIAKKSLIFLLLFPTSFYFGSVYTESLFLALILGSFYATRKKQWGMAGILGALASATRPVGIFLFPALLVEWHRQKTKNKKQKTKNFLALLFVGFGLLVYMWYLQRTVGDPFYFIHVQPFFGAQRTGGKIILLYQVFWRYFKMLVTVEKTTLTYFVVVLEFLSGLLFLLLSIFAYLRLRLSYFIFMVFAYLTPTLTGTLSSMPRYVLVLFPGFILLAIWAEKYRWLKILYPIIAGILLIISSILFTRGYWVA